MFIGQRLVLKIATTAVMDKRRVKPLPSKRRKGFPLVSPNILILHVLFSLMMTRLNFFITIIMVTRYIVCAVVPVSLPPR